MSRTFSLRPRWILAGLILVSCCITAADAQDPARAKKPAPTAKPAAANDDYVLRTYDVGDLVINVQDHPYSASLQSAESPIQHGGGGGMGGGGYGGGGGGGGGVFSVP